MDAHASSCGDCVTASKRATSGGDRDCRGAKDPFESEGVGSLQARCGNRGLAPRRQSSTPLAFQVGDARRRLDLASLVFVCTRLRDFNRNASLLRGRHVDHRPPCTGASHGEIDPDSATLRFHSAPEQALQIEVSDQYRQRSSWCRVVCISPTRGQNFEVSRKQQHNLNI